MSRLAEIARTAPKGAILVCDGSGDVKGWLPAGPTEDGTYPVFDTRVPLGVRFEPDPGPAATEIIVASVWGSASSAGTSPAHARGDHVHGLPANPVTAHVGATDPHPGKYATGTHDHGAANEHFHDDNHIPSSIARDTEVTAAIATHAATPHGTTAHTHVDADLPAGLARDAEVAAMYAALGHAHVDADIPASIARDSEVAAAYQALSGKNIANGYAGLDASSLVPRARLGTGTADATTFLRGDGTWDVPAGGGGGGSQAPWRGKVHTLWGDGNPAQQDVNWSFQNTAVSVAAPTPTGIGATVGRLVSCRFETSITVNTLRYFGLASVANYTAAIYNGATGARIWTATLSVAAGWNAIALGGSAFTLPADTLLWFGIGTTGTGTTAGFRSPASPIANSLGITTLPGNLAQYLNRFAQVTLVAGAWPATLPSLAAAAFASAGATGTVPIFFADNA